MNRVKKPILSPKQAEDTWVRDRSCGRISFKLRGRQKKNPKKIKKAPLKKAIVLIHSFINSYIPLERKIYHSPPFTGYQHKILYAIVSLPYSN
jgi:hypothetical protein